MTKIGHAASDERGKYAGGEAGDQTKKEVCIRDWYNRPWNVVFWATDATIRENMAQAMEQACANDHIGYDQGTAGNTQDRYSLYNALSTCNFIMSKVTKNVETDCSNLVACCANCAGVKISPYIATSTERKAFKSAKDEVGNKIEFEFHTESKYLTSPDNNPRGAVLLYEGHHTAIQTENGKNWQSSSSTKRTIPIETLVTGTLKIVGTTSLALRDYPSTTGTNIKSTAKQNEEVKVISKTKMDGKTWFKTQNNLWMSGNYVEGILTEADKRSWIVELGYKYSTSTLKTYNGKTYCLDKEGWIITPDKLNKDGSLKC